MLKYFDDLASIWGGSLATEPLLFGIDNVTFTISLSDIVADQNKKVCISAAVLVHFEHLS